MKPCEKLVYVCKKPSEFSKQKPVPYIFCGSNLKAIIIIIRESKAFSSRTILKFISKIGTYSYCTPLLICVGDCATVLVAWLPIIFYYRNVEKFGLSRQSHNLKVASSNLAVATLLLLSRK